MKAFGRITLSQADYQGEKRWLVSFSTYENGKRKYHRYTRRSKTDALNLKRKIETDRQSPIASFPLDKQADAAAALATSIKHGFTLSQAVAFYLQNHSPTVEAALNDAIRGFLDAQEKKNLRPRSIGSYRATLNSFAFGQRQTLVSGVTSQQIADYIEDQEWGDLRARRFLTEMGTFFTYCIKKQHIKSSPTSGIDKPRIDPADVQPLTVPECREILKVTRTHYPEALAHIAIGLFAGVRSNEIMRIGWGNINLDEGFIDLNISSAKKRQRRLPRIAPILKEWLLEARSLESPLPSPRYYHKRRQIMSKAGIENAPGNILRKTCVSYHVAYHSNIPLAMDQFGHSESVLFQHYRGVVKKKESDKFWEDLTVSSC